MKRYILILLVFLTVPLSAGYFELTKSEKMVRKVLSSFDESKIFNVTLYSSDERNDITALTRRVLKEQRNQGELGLAAVSAAVKDFNENYNVRYSEEVQQIQDGIAQELIELELSTIDQINYLISSHPQTAAVLGETAIGGCFLGVSCLFPPCTLPAAIISLTCGLWGSKTLYDYWDEVGNGLMALDKRDKKIEELREDLYKKIK